MADLYQIFKKASELEREGVAKIGQLAKSWSPLSLVRELNLVAGAKPLKEWDYVPLNMPIHIEPQHIIDEIKKDPVGEISEIIAAPLAGNSASNFQAILRTGNANSDRIFGIIPAQGSLSVDFAAKDSLTTSLNKIRRIATERLESDSFIQELLTKPVWTKQDRIDWESVLSNIVTREAHKIAGLKTYRADIAFPGYSVAPYSNKLNDLSYDITHDTKHFAYQCAQQAFLEGIVMQQIENKLLPKEDVGNNYKHRSNYFYMTGDVDFAGSDGIGRHAFIMSSVTGGLTESTLSLNSYSSPKPGMSFERFVRGDAFLTDDGSVYGSNLSIGQVEEARTLRAQASNLQMPTMLAGPKGP